jgi:hypothetical protein
MVFRFLRINGWFIYLIHLISCSSVPHKTGTKTDPAETRPSIYDAWDARYSYDSNLRKMEPIFNGKVVGRAWARDNRGQLNYSVYTGRTGEIDEDLFPLHIRKLDNQRNKEWEQNKVRRMEDVSEMLRILEEDKKEPLIEVLIEEEEDEFIPPAFMPSGIDFEGSATDTPPFNPMSSDGEESAPAADELSPFLPLP